jgi:hypothetical protein
MAIQIRLIADNLDELNATIQELGTRVGDQIELHMPRDGRNGEWIVYGTWTPAAQTAAEPARPESAEHARPDVMPLRPDEGRWQAAS